MKLSLTIFIVLFSMVAMAEEPIFTRAPSSLYNHIPEAPTTRCSVFKDKVVVTHSVNGLAIAETRHVKLEGDFESEIADLAKGSLKKTDNFDGPPYYQYTAKGLMFKNMGGTDGVQNDSLSTLPLVFLINQVCK